VDVKVLGNGLKLLEKGMKLGFPPSSRLLAVAGGCPRDFHSTVCAVYDLRVASARGLVNPRAMAAEARVPMALSSPKGM
jgi:hypothetical protein